MKNLLKICFYLGVLLFYSCEESDDQNPLDSSNLLFTDGFEWQTISSVYFMVEPGFEDQHVIDTITYYFSGDTVFDGSIRYLTYKYNSISTHSGFNRGKYYGSGTLGYFRIDNALKNVFYKHIASSEEELLYDFSLDINDSIQVRTNEHTSVIRDIDTLMLGQHQLKRYYTYHNNGKENYIQGIGSSIGLPLYGMGFEHPTFLVYFKINGIKYSKTDIY